MIMKAFKRITLIIILLLIGAIILSFCMLVTSFISYKERYINNRELVNIIYADEKNSQSVVIDKNTQDHLELFVYDYWWDGVYDSRTLFGPDDCWIISNFIARSGEVDENFVLTFNFSNGTLIEFSDCSDNRFRKVLIDLSKSKGIVTPVISNFSNYSSYEIYEIYGTFLMFGRMLDWKSATLEDIYGNIDPDFCFLENAIINEAVIITDEYSLNDFFVRPDSWLTEKGTYSLQDAINEVSRELGLDPILQVAKENQRDYEAFDRHHYYDTHPDLYGTYNSVEKHYEEYNTEGTKFSMINLKKSIIQSIVLIVVESLFLFQQIIIMVLCNKATNNSFTVRKEA